MNCGGIENKSPALGSPPGLCCIVGFGNARRRDDGLGPHVVGALARTLGEGAGLRFMVREQLEPDLAEDLREADEIILVDATVERLPEGWRKSIITPRLDAPPYLTHSLKPEYLLGLLGWLYDRRPACLLVSVQGEDFGMGTGLSPAAQKRACQVVADLAKSVSKED
jgi:hydrogenase maturation protease